MTASVCRIENFCTGVGETPVEGVWQTTRIGVVGGDHGRQPPCFHQQDVWAHVVAANLDVIGQRRQHPHAAAAVQAAGCLEMDRAAEQLVDKRERLVVLHDPVALADDPERLAVVLATVASTGISVARRWPHARRIAVVDRDRLLRHVQPRPDASIASPTVAGGWSSTAPRPCQGVTRTENIESESVSPAGMSSSFWMDGSARCGAGRSPGRIPVRGCKNWPGKPAPASGVTDIAPCRQHH